MKTRAGSLIEFRRELDLHDHARWSIWFDSEAKGEWNEKLDVELWVMNATEKGIVARPDGYYETETVRLIWDDLVRNHGMVRYTELENVTPNWKMSNEQAKELHSSRSYLLSRREASSAGQCGSVVSRSPQDATD